MTTHNPDLFTGSAYILIGDNNSGKTTFQKKLIKYLCNKDVDTRLNVNVRLNITHYNSSRKLKTLFTMNRSVQEKMGEYNDIANFFDSFFKDADVCILSSHIDEDHIKQMIEHLQKRFYDVGAVFFDTNSTGDISKNLNWDLGRHVIHNPMNNDSWESQIKSQACKFGESIIKNSYLR